MSNNDFTEPEVWTNADIAAHVPTLMPIGACPFPCATFPVQSEGIARKCSIAHGFANLKCQEGLNFEDGMCIGGGFQQAAGGAYGQQGGRYGGGFSGRKQSTGRGASSYGNSGGGRYGGGGQQSGGDGSGGTGSGDGRPPGGNSGANSGQQQGGSNGTSYSYANNTKPAKTDNKIAMAAVDAHAEKVILHGDGSKSATTSTKNSPSPKEIELTKHKHGLRTSFGSKGTPVEIVTNYLDLTLPSRIYVYKLDMFRKYVGPASPQKVAVARIADKKIVVETMRTSQLQNRVPELQRSPQTWASDGDLIWSTTLLWPAITTNSTRVHTLRNFTYVNEMGVQLVLSEIDILFQQAIDLTGSIPGIFFNPTSHAPDQSVPAILTRGLNAFLTADVRRNLGVTSVGSNKSFRNHAGLMLRGAGQATLRALTGFFISARPGVERMFINVNTTASPFFLRGTVAEFINLSRLAGRSDGDIRTALKGCKVRISYQTQVPFQTESERCRFISEIPLGLAGQAQNVLTKDGQTTLLSWHASNAQAGDAPRPPITGLKNSQCVNVGKATAIQNGTLVEWYPIQYLQIIEFHTYRARLTGDENTAMLRVACQSPQTNVDSILNHGLRQFSFNVGANQGGLHDFGNTQAGQQLLSIAARWLPTPVLRYRTTNANITNAGWDLKGVKFSSTSLVAHLPLLNFGVTLPPTFTIIMRQALASYGLLAGNSHVQFNVTDVPPAFYQHPPFSAQQESSVENGLRLLNVATNTTLLVLIPRKEFDFYAVVKRVAELKLGIKTVLCTAPLVGKMNVQVAANLALKFNIKGMGDNHRLGATEIMPLRGNAASNGAFDTIVLGADVGHPGKGCSTATPSIASVVGSVDREFMLYPGSMRLQPSGQEFIQDLTDMVKERLLDWHNKNGALPKRVLFYRDGVSESQYAAVRDNEIPQIQKAFNNAQIVIDEAAKKAIIHSDKSPDVPFELTFVVVGKRHNTRFYPLKETDSFRKGNGQTNGNVKPGLVVDQVITHPFVMDFYLQSHNPIQGTGRSAHYYVITNGMRLTADEMQSITHSFCYTYARATKGVSYCAPAYYADRLCDRGRAWLRHWITNQPEAAYQPYRKFRTPHATNRNETVLQYNTDIAQHLSTAAYYAPHQGLPRQYGGPRKNPWHPNLDGCMFYL